MINPNPVNRASIDLLRKALTHYDAEYPTDEASVRSALDMLASIEKHLPKSIASGTSIAFGTTMRVSGADEQVPGIEYPTTYADLARLPPEKLWNRYSGGRPYPDAKTAFLAARAIPQAIYAIVSTPEMEDPAGDVSQKSIDRQNDVAAIIEFIETVGQVHKYDVSEHIKIMNSITGSGDQRQKENQNGKAEGDNLSIGRVQFPTAQ